MTAVAMRIAEMAWAQARQVARQAMPLPGSERLSLPAAVGRTLALEVTSAVASPAADTAAMDGYAIAGRGPWTVIGRLVAGGPPWAEPLREGQAVEIATGAVVPRGTHAVIPYELSEVHADLLTAPPPAKRHIRQAGEDFAAATVIASPGQTVSATMSAAMAQAGVDEVWVARRPSVFLIVTGDEVVASGEPLVGQVRDAHTAVVTSLVRRAGGVLAGSTAIGDDLLLLRQAMQSAASVADVVAVSGSSSKGRADHLREVIAGLGGRWLVDGVRCRPGHPQALARTPDDRWVVGLPGNPFAGLVAGLTLLEPLVSSLAGRAPAVSVRLPVFGPAQACPDGVRLVPVNVAGGHAIAVAGARPASLQVAAQTGAVAVIEPSWTEGAQAELLFLP